MPTFFNNCRCRKHVDLFGPNAFFDLTQKQSDIAGKIEKNCVVASYDDDGDVVFGWYSLARERWMPDPDTGDKVPVSFGKKLKSQCLSKIAAANKAPYSRFFNKVGSFKRQSTIAE